MAFREVAHTSLQRLPKWAEPALRPARPPQKHTGASDPGLSPVASIYCLKFDRVVIDGDARPHGGRQRHFADIHALSRRRLSFLEISQHGNVVTVRDGEARFQDGATPSDNTVRRS